MQPSSWPHLAIPPRPAPTAVPMLGHHAVALPRRRPDRSPRPARRIPAGHPRRRRDPCRGRGWLARPPTRSVRIVAGGSQAVTVVVGLQPGQALGDDPRGRAGRHRAAARHCAAGPHRPARFPGAPSAGGWGGCAAGQPPWRHRPGLGGGGQPGARARDDLCLRGGRAEGRLAGLRPDDLGVGLHAGGHRRRRRGPPGPRAGWADTAAESTGRRSAWPSLRPGCTPGRRQLVRRWLR